MVSLLTPQKKKLISNLIKENKHYPTNWGWEGLGQLIYLRTYARDMFKRVGTREWKYEHELTDHERVNIDKLISTNTFKHRKETWAETIGRVIRGALNIGTPLNDDEIKLMFQSMLDLKMSVSGRALWQLDTKLPNSGLMDSLLNCWFHSMDKTVNFLKIFEKLMLGGGVGFSIQKEFIQHLPSVVGGEIYLNNSLSYIDTLVNVLNIKGLNNQAYELEEVYSQQVKELTARNEEHLSSKIRLSDLKDLLSEETFNSASEIEEKGFIDELDHDNSIDRIIYVGDSREGWVELLKTVLDTHFAKGGVLAFNTSLVRPYGSLIKGFGGKASGDAELIKGMFQISALLSNAVGRQLTSVEVMDIVCIIASIVVSGNVRRSALLALGDGDDVEYITSKDWSKGNVPNYRAMANLSVATHDTSTLPKEFWDSYRNKDGECIGLFNLENAQNFGRMGKNKEKDLINYFNQRGEIFFKDKNIDEVTLVLEDGSRVYKADPMVKGCNPCYDKLSAILTNKGIIEIQHLKKGDIIWSKEGWTKVLDIWSNGIKPVYRYRTTRSVFYGTENHKVSVKGDMVEIGNTDKVDLIIGNSEINYNNFNPQIVMDGLVFGDGYYSSNASESISPNLGIGINDQDYFNSEISHLILNKCRKSEDCVQYKVITNIKMGEFGDTHNKIIPNRYKTLENIQSFLRGLYSANGSIVGGARVTLKSVNQKLIEDVQIMLNAIGIPSFYTTNKEAGVQHHNGYYIGSESYDLNVSNTELFEQKIGFLQKYKMEKLRKINEKKKCKPFKGETVKIIEKTYIGDREVFDLAVDNESHSLWTSGLNTSNCFDQNQYCLTPNGLKHIKDINIGDTIYGKDGWTKVLNKWSNGIKEIWEVKTKDGGKFIGTLDHQVFDNGVKKKIKDVNSIDTFRNYYTSLMKDERPQCIPSPIISKIYLKRDEVFDLTVDNESHSLWSDNLHVSNCAEMNGDDGENCNLSVINISRIETYEELFEIAKLLYKFQKAITQGEYIFKDDQVKINQNSRIGIGITDVLSNFEKNKEWGSRLYEDLRAFDIEYSKEMGYPQSIKLTVQKPDGTLGLLMGAKAGIHLDNSPFWYRTVRFASNDPLVKVLQEKGYRVEDKLNFDKTVDPSLKVVYFACKSSTPQMTELNTSARDQIHFNIEWQEAFVDQSVSQTVKFQQNEVEDIITIMDSLYRDNIKAISFLRHSNFSFDQMPYQTISEEEYNNYINQVQPLGIIDLGKDDEFGLDDMSEGACEGGVCPIK